MAYDPRDRPDDDIAAPSDQDEISSLFLASDLIIEQFVAVLSDFRLSDPDVEAPAAPVATSGEDCPARRFRRRRIGAALTVAPEAGAQPWTIAMAARCAILLRRELEG